MPDNQLGTQTAAGTTTETTPDWSKLLDPTNGKILGKYDVAKPEEAFKGHWELQNHASQVERENAALKSALSEIATRVNPQQQAAARPSYMDELTTMGIPIDPLEKLIEERVNARVQSSMEAQFAPITRTMQARTEMAAQYPEYATKEGAVMAFIGQHPDLSETYNAMAKGASALSDPKESARAAKAALDYAYLKFREYNPDVRQSGVDAGARAAAGMPNAGTGGAADGSRVSNQVQNTKALDEALQYHRSTRDEKPFVAAWFEGMPLTWEEQQRAAMQAQR